MMILWTDGLYWMMVTLQTVSKEDLEYCLKYKTTNSVKNTPVISVLQHKSVTSCSLVISHTVHFRSRNECNGGIFCWNLTFGFTVEQSASKQLLHDEINE